MIWVGNGPLFVAQEKGFFAREGVEVELIDMAIHEASYAGLFAGQIDVISVTVDDMLPNFDPEQPYVCVLAIDESLGGDGIIASNDIQSIADLRGKAVAFPKRTVSQFYLNVLLKNTGLSEADIEPVEMSFDDAANAFLMQEVDAAVTAEPWLTHGERSEHGHLLADSSETPGLIVDCLVTPGQYLPRSPGGVPSAGARLGCGSGLCRGPSRRGQRDHGQERRWLARRSRGVRRDPEGRPVLRCQENREYFGTPEEPGQIYQTSQYAIDVWKNLGALDVPLTPADVIRHDLWTE